MKFSLPGSSTLALMAGIAATFGLGVAGTAPPAQAQSTAAPSAPSATVPPAATPTVPQAAGTTAPAEVPAPGGTPNATPPGKPAHHFGSNGLNGYLARLHDQLKITPAEESLWTDFANVMRDNASTLGKAYRQRRQQLPTMNALQDMNSFIDLEQQRLDGLKKNSAAFAALYNAMPPDQQKIADIVFLSDLPGGPHPRAPKAAK